MSVRILVISQKGGVAALGSLGVFFRHRLSEAKKVLTYRDLGLARGGQGDQTRGQGVRTKKEQHMDIDQIHQFTGSQPDSQSDTEQRKQQYVQEAWMLSYSPTCKMTARHCR